MFHARGGGAGFPRDLWVEQVRCEGRGSEKKKEPTRAFRSHGTGRRAEAGRRKGIPFGVCYI